MIRGRILAFCRAVETISEWSGKTLSFFIVPMFLVLVYEVVMRYAFNAPTRFAQETSVFIYGTTGILGGAYVLLHDGHVRMDAIYGRLSSRTQAIVDLATSSFFFFFCGLLLWQGWEMGYFSFATREHTGTSWGPPYYPIKLVIPLATFLILLQGLAKFIRNLNSAIGKDLS